MLPKRNKSVTNYLPYARLYDLPKTRSARCAKSFCHIVWLILRNCNVHHLLLMLIVNVIDLANPPPPARTDQQICCHLQQYATH